MDENYNYEDNSTKIQGKPFDIFFLNNGVIGCLRQTEEKKVKYTSVGSVTVIIAESGIDVQCSNSARVCCVLFMYKDAWER